MKAQEYLKQRLEKSSFYSLSSEDEKDLKEGGMVDFILGKLLSKKFRKWKLSEACSARTCQAVEIAVRDNVPLPIIFPMGGYKLWRLPSSPEADWAEFFNIAYLTEYAAPVAAAYNPGVKLEYYLHTLLMEKHDNLTQEEIKAYTDSFEVLLREFSRHFPKNMSMSILRDADLYSRKEYFKLLEEGYQEAKEQYKTWNEEKKTEYRRLAELNIRWKGKEDWTKLSAKEKEQKLLDGALYETAAVYNLRKAQETVKSEKNVLVFTKTNDQFIGIGSTRTSMVKFWTGLGVLEKEGGRFYERVLSPLQYEAVKNKKHRVEKVELLSLRNLMEIQVYLGRLEFTKREK